MQGGGNFIEHGGVVDCRRHLPAFLVGDLLHGAAQDLAGAGLGQSLDADRRLEGSDWPNPFPNKRHDFPLDLCCFTGNIGINDQKPRRNLALDRIGNADHSTFGDIGVAGADLFHRSGRQAMPGNIDDIVGAT